MINISRNRIKPLRNQVKDTLRSKLAIGQSKYDDKAKHIVNDYGELIIEQEDRTHNKIYSWKTYQTYEERSLDFVDWCMNNHNEVKTLADCWQYRNEYVQELIDNNKSPYTIKLVVSALSKLYDRSSADFIDTPPRLRENITRSRIPTERDKHFSEKRNAELVNFCRCTGLRRSELENLRGNDLTYINGVPYVYVHRDTKGGRMRYAPIVGTEEEVQQVVDRMHNVGSEKVWHHINKAMDVHSYRAEYCSRVYYKNERDPYELPREQTYHCRGDKEGLYYDKRALQVASEALGHSRIGIVASNYLRAPESGLSA